MGYLVIAAFVGLVLLGLAQWGRIVRHRDRAEPRPRPEQKPAGERDERPDRPRPFGPRMAWFAVRARDAEDVVRALRMRTVLPANWQSGLAAAGSAGVFVTPPVGGWVFVAGRDAFPRTRGAPDPVEELIGLLGARFGRALWFATHDATDFHGWAVAEGGVVVRGFAYDGDGPAIVWNHGAVTDAEHGLGFFVDDPRDTTDDPIKWWPTTGDVLALAAALGADPTGIDGFREPSVGRLGRL
jgi:hypothetical protein